MSNKIDETKPQKLKKKSALNPAFYVKLVKGFRDAIVGTLAATKNKYVQKKFSHALLKVVVAVTIIYTILMMFYFPIKHIYSLFMSTFIGELSPLEEEDMTPFNVFIQISVFIPVLGIGVYRYFLPKYAEKMFYSGLSDLSPELSNKLKNHDGRDVHRLALFLRYAKRMMILGVFGSIIFLLSNLPYVGFLVIPLAQFWYSRMAIGTNVAALLAIVSCFSGARYYSKLFLNLLISSAALGRELLDPYYIHLPEEQMNYFRARYYGSIIGFSLPYALVLSIPLVGLPCWGIAQAAVPALIISVLKRNPEKEETKYLFGEEVFLKDKSSSTIEQKLE